MKKSVIIPILTAATLLLGGCKFEYPLPDILSDPTFEESGFQRYITVSIYEQSPLSLTIQRNAGLSKELTVDIVVDQAVLDEYNRVNETSHKMLPAKYYSLSPTATFEARSKEAEITGTIYAEQIVKDRMVSAREAFRRMHRAQGRPGVPHDVHPDDDLRNTPCI